MSQTIEHLNYSVPGLSCDHCRIAVTAEVGSLAGVSDVEVDVDAKRVHVAGVGLDDAEIRAAIDEAGYDIAQTWPFAPGRSFTMFTALNTALRW